MGQFTPLRECAADRGGGACGRPCIIAVVCHSLENVRFPLPEAGPSIANATVGFGRKESAQLLEFWGAKPGLP